MFINNSYKYTTQEVATKKEIEIIDSFLDEIKTDELIDAVYMQVDETTKKPTVVIYVIGHGNLMNARDVSGHLRVRFASELRQSTFHYQLLICSMLGIITPGALEHERIVDLAKKKSFGKVLFDRNGLFSELSHQIGIQKEMARVYDISETQTRFLS